MNLPEHRVTPDAVRDQYKRVENSSKRLYSNIPISELREAVGMLNDYAESQRNGGHIFIARHIERISDSLIRVKDYFNDVVELDQIRDHLGEVTYSDYISEVYDG